MNTTITGEDVVRAAKKYVGLKYVFGAKAVPGHPVTALDCSGLVSVVCRDLNVKPPMIDGSGNQLAHCNQFGLGKTVDEAWKISGALLFRRNKKSHAIEHVAISTGGGNSVEARGAKYGVGVFIKRQGFTDAALIPGVEYK
jgi:cell wall-associated NlpC family hydrolase